MKFKTGTYVLYTYNNDTILHVKGPIENLDDAYRFASGKRNTWNSLIRNADDEILRDYIKKDASWCNCDKVAYEVENKIVIENIDDFIEV